MYLALPYGIMDKERQDTIWCIQSKGMGVLKKYDAVMHPAKLFDVTGLLFQNTMFLLVN